MIYHIASKISKIVGIIARLRHRVPLNTPLQINLPFADISLHALRYSCLGSGFPE